MSKKSKGNASTLEVGEAAPLKSSKAHQDDVSRLSPRGGHIDLASSGELPNDKEEDKTSASEAPGSDGVFKIPHKKKKEGSGLLKKKKEDKKKNKKKAKASVQPREGDWVNFEHLNAAADALGFTNDPSSSAFHNRKFGACFTGKECIDWLMATDDDTIFCSSRGDALALASQLLENKYFVRLIDANDFTFNEATLYCVPRPPKRGSLRLISPVSFSVRRKRSNSDLSPRLEYKVDLRKSSPDTNGELEGAASPSSDPSSSLTPSGDSGAVKAALKQVEKYVSEEVESSRKLQQQVIDLKDKLRKLKRERKGWLLKSSAFSSQEDLLRSPAPSPSAAGHSFSNINGGEESGGSTRSSVSDVKDSDKDQEDEENDDDEEEEVEDHNEQSDGKEKKKTKHKKKHKPKRKEEGGNRGIGSAGSIGKPAGENEAKEGEKESEGSGSKKKRRNSKRDSKKESKITFVIPAASEEENLSGSNSRSPFKRASSFSSLEDMEDILKEFREARGKNSAREPKPHAKERGGYTWNKRKLTHFATEGMTLKSARLPSEETPTPEMRAKDIFGQFLESEKLYVHNLQKFIQVFIDPMRNPKEDTLITIDEVLDAGFARLERISALHEEILKKSSQADSFVFLLAFIPHLKLHYVDYITRHPAVVQRILDARAANTKFRSFLAGCWGAADMDIESYLILPVQRLPRYELLVNDYIKFMSLTRGEKANLKSMEELAQHLKHIALEANESRRRLENVAYLTNLQDRITSKIGQLDLLEETRSLVREGDCCFWGMDQKFIQAHYFLFTDIMLVAVKESASTRRRATKDRYKLKHLLQVNHIQIKQNTSATDKPKTESEDFTVSIAHTRSVGFKDDTFHIKTESKEEKAMLVADLRRLTRRVGLNGSGGGQTVGE